MTGTEKRRGHPPERVWPEPIPDTPENMARALMASKPKAADEWKHLQEPDS